MIGISCAASPMTSSDRSERTTSRTAPNWNATLRVFLGNDGHWSTTAADLYVHVNTLRNRVARIGELTGRDVTRLQDRVDLFLALEADTLS